MDEDLTLDSIKDMLEKFTSKKSLFTDKAILNKIEESCKKIREEVERKSPRILELLKRCSEEIKDLKIKNNSLESSECVECLLILNKIKKDIEGIRKDNLGLKKKLWICRILFVPVLSLLLGIFLNKYFLLLCVKLLSVFMR